MLPHLVILHLYARNQAQWADFAELRGQYRVIAQRCSRVDLIVPRGTSAACPDDSRLHIHQVAGSLRQSLRFAISALRRIHEIHRESPIHVLWAQDPFVCGITGWIASRRYSFPFVVEICNDFFDLSALGAGAVERWCKGTIASSIARRAARVRAVSSGIRDQLVRRGVPASSIAVLCCPTDMRLFDFEPHAREREGIRSSRGLDANQLVMFLGALIDRKGVDLLLEAAALLRPEFPLLRVAIVGDGPSRGRFEARTAALGLTSVVAFWGRLPQPEVPGALACADAVVLPSRNEGLPRCLVEALAMQRPAVATRISGNVEVLRDGETGILVEPTVNGIREGIARVLRLSGEERARMGRRGREWVLARYGLEEIAGRMSRELIDALAACAPETGR